MARLLFTLSFFCFSAFHFPRFYWTLQRISLEKKLSFPHTSARFLFSLCCRSLVDPTQRRAVYGTGVGSVFDPPDTSCTVLDFWKRSFWRVAYFCVINFTLLPLASFSVPQNNVISLVRFFNDHEEIETVYSYEDSVVLEPKAFSLRPFAAVPFSQELSRYSADTGCRSVLAVRSDKYKANPEFEKGFPIRGIFKPGPLEALLVRLNPRQNARRGSIFLLSPRGCPWFKRPSLLAHSNATVLS